MIVESRPATANSPLVAAAPDNRLATPPPSEATLLMDDEMGRKVGLGPDPFCIKGREPVKLDGLEGTCPVGGAGNTYMVWRGNDKCR